MVELNNDWDLILKGEFDKPYYLELRSFLVNEYKTQTIYPDMHDIFNALKLSSYENTRVVILGQDPYHGEEQAHGLSFSVKKGIEPPPSLRNIYLEQKTDLGIVQPHHGDLTWWAQQGVLLLNAVLTVRAHTPNSHKGKGWEQFTNRVIAALNQKDTPVVFLLWGANARNKASIITNPIHLKLECPHPSPLSAYNGFFGCRHFSKTNELLVRSGQQPIDWQLKD
ncbi:MAG: uracil-DNA glycosylase [Eubacteriales bacterium]|nr:uracil-DNA glycosylase [Eubacteriales bacterium]